MTRFSENPNYEGTYKVQNNGRTMTFQFTTLQTIQYQAPRGGLVTLESGTVFSGGGALIISQGTWCVVNTLVNSYFYECLETNDEYLKVTNLDTLPETVLAHVLNSASYLDGGEGLEASEQELANKGMCVSWD